MARRATIRTDEILQVAREVFLQRGADAPTAEIARRAGVSEGSIFRRFPTKQELFLAAMGMDTDPPWLEELEQLATDDVRQELCDLALHIIDSVREMVPRMMLLWSSRELGGQIMRDQAGSPRRKLVALTDYFDRQMRAGRMRMAHPEICARIFVGSIFNFAFLEAMGIEVHGPIDAKTYVQSLVDTLWQGLAPQTESAI